MEEIQLKDICDLDNGYAFKSDDYVELSGTLNCRMSNIRPDGSFDILYSAKYLPDEFAEKYADYVLKDGDLIIAMTDMAGDPKILGVPTVVDTKGYTLLLNQRVGKLRFIKTGINADYLKFALQSKRVREYLKRFAGGGVQLNVSKKDILNAPVRMRSIEEQDRIADLFQRVLKLKKLREQKLQSLDNLIKARFVEMFGDPVTNEKEWETKPLLSMGSCKNGMNFHYDDSGVELNCLGVGDFKDYSIIADTASLPTVSLNEMPSPEYLLQNDDIVFVRSNGNKKMVGRSVAVYPGSVPTTFSGFCIRYRRNDDTVLTPYLLRVLKADSVRQKMYGRGANIQNLNQQTLSSLDIPVPPKEMQEQFTDFVKQVDKSKVEVKKALDETQALFDSLMQEYFG